jgi:hypothetical protein
MTVTGRNVRDSEETRHDDESSFHARRMEVLQSPLLVGIAVSAADPSGLFGASARALLQAKADPNADELVKAVAEDFGTSEGRGLAQDGLKALLGGGGKPADITPKALDALKAVSALLASKAPADAAAYKTWLAGVAKAVAEAAPEGAAFSASAGRR